MHEEHASRELISLRSVTAEILVQARNSAFHPSALAAYEDCFSMVNAACVRAKVRAEVVRAHASLTTHELAATWRKSAWTIREYAKTGRVPGARKIGRDWLFPADPVLLPPAESVDAETDDLLEHLDSCLKAE